MTTPPPAKATPPAKPVSVATFYETYKEKFGKMLDAMGQVE